MTNESGGTEEQSLCKAGAFVYRFVAVTDLFVHATRKPSSFTLYGQ